MGQMYKTNLQVKTKTRV